LQADGGFKESEVRSVHPYLVRIPLPWGGTFRVASYGFLIMCGFLASLYIAWRRAKRFGIDPSGLFDAAVGALIGGIVGARLLYVIYEWPAFRAEPLKVIRLDEGGLVFLGGAALGTLTLAFIVAKRKLPLLRSLDVAASVLPLGHAFGRMGCFLNGCCYGSVTGSWVGVRFLRVLDPRTGELIGSPVFLDHMRQGLVPQAAARSLPVHPTQLYEAGYNLAIFALLSFWLTRRWREGEVGWLYLALYGAARFANEFLRADSSRVLGLTVAQAMCLPMVALAVAMVVRGRMLPRQPLPAPRAPSIPRAKPRKKAR